MAELASAAIEGGRSIGRYFAVISLVPSLLFVIYVYGLLQRGHCLVPLNPCGQCTQLNI